MADKYNPFNNIPSAGISPDNPLAPEYLALERQKRIADLLMSKSQQVPEGQMVSGHFVAPSFTQQLQPLFNAYIGQNMAQGTESKTAQLAQMLRGQQDQVVQSFINAKTPADKFKAATSSNAPSWLQTLGADMLKSQKVGEGEVISQLDLNTGENKTILKGPAKDTRTEKQKDYEYYKDNTGKNITFDQYIDRITPVEQQRLNNERRRIQLEENKLIDEGVNVSSTGVSPVENTFPLSRGPNSTHAGVDIQTPVNTPIIATHEGVVRYNTKDKSGYGNMIEIVDPNTKQVKARYAHLNSFDVPEGTIVKPGQILGKTGGIKNDVGAGNSTGPHLHYEDLTKPNIPPNLSPKDQRAFLKEFSINQTKPLTGEAQKQVTGAMNFQDSIDNYRSILANFKTTDMASPEKRAILESAYNTMILQGKEANNLGVLNGGDERILKSLFPNPNDLKTITISKDNLDKFALDQKKFAGTIIKNVYEVNQKPVPRSMQGRLTPTNEINKITEEKTKTSPQKIPKGVTPAEWNVMTAEERKAFE
jgi:murein DD-endopeptidase MepM/ murein hydrolase activator NlpD